MSADPRGADKNESEIARANVSRCPVDIIVRGRAPHFDHRKSRAELTKSAARPQQCYPSRNRCLKAGCTLTPTSFKRPISALLIAARSSRLSNCQLAISDSVRAQPMHRPIRGSIVQIETQGDTDVIMVFVMSRQNMTERLALPRLAIIILFAAHRPNRLYLVGSGVSPR